MAPLCQNRLASARLCHMAVRNSGGNLDAGAVKSPGVPLRRHTHMLVKRSTLELLEERLVRPRRGGGCPYTDIWIFPPALLLLPQGEVQLVQERDFLCCLSSPVHSPAGGRSVPFQTNTVRVRQQPSRTRYPRYWSRTPNRHATRSLVPRTASMFGYSLIYPS